MVSLPRDSPAGPGGGFQCLFLSRPERFAGRIRVGRPWGRAAIDNPVPPRAAVMPPAKSARRCHGDLHPMLFRSILRSSMNPLRLAILLSAAFLLCNCATDASKARRQDRLDRREAAMDGRLDRASIRSDARRSRWQRMKSWEDERAKRMWESLMH